VLASGAALPWLARAHAAGELRGAALRLAGPLGLAGFVLAVPLLLLGEPLLGLFGEEFRAGSGALAWLTGALIAVHFGAPLLTALVATGRVRHVAGVAVSALALNVVLNALAVPRYGMEGAAAATVATEVAVALLALAGLPARRRPTQPSAAPTLGTQQPRTGQGP
jgi:O-antigen/teichoic acid export membrane protein